MSMPTYESWIDSLSEEELEYCYKLGGSKDAIGLMRAYYNKCIVYDNMKRDEAKEYFKQKD